MSSETTICHRLTTVLFLALVAITPAVVVVGDLGEAVTMTGLFQAEYRDIHSSNVDDAATIRRGSLPFCHLLEFRLSL